MYGNTPTHVGKTLTMSFLSQRNRKHPHARGENSPCQTLAVPSAETPPRTWGKRICVINREWPHRNTPTHVGKTHSTCAAQIHLEKHPHARGENREVVIQATLIMETPPRTWGKPLPGFLWLSVSRNTPTHVGKTMVRIINGEKQSKHPHARGENTCFQSQAILSQETPPRTWGKLPERRGNRRVWRNTPTHVGKTRSFLR